ALAPEGLPRIEGVRLGAGSVVFGLLLAGAVGLGLSAYPLLAHAGGRMVRSLAEGTRASAGRERQRTRSVLVVAQMALAVTLLVGAGLLIRTVSALHRAEVGFEPE